MLSELLMSDLFSDAQNSLGLGALRQHTFEGISSNSFFGFTGIPAPKRGIYDQQIANMASECVGFIQGRKQFWSLQTSPTAPNNTTMPQQKQDLLL